MIEYSDSLEVVIKVAERCNINCSYCYVFNKGNESYKSKPVKISRQTMQDTVLFVADGIRDLKVRSVAVVFHGGEPLMMGKRDFDYFATVIRENIEHLAVLRIVVQTNAMLIDDEWIALFAKHQIAVGVSLDGIASVHDSERKDFKGRGTYARTVRGLKALQQAAEAGSVPWPGIICVVQPIASGRSTYRHFIDDLHIRGITFHLPMETHDSFGDQDPLSYAAFICEAFDEWVKDNDPTIDVRIFSQLIGFFQGKVGALPADKRRINLQHVTIESDGSVDVDEFKPANISTTEFNVSRNRLIDYVNSDFSEYVRAMYSSLPEGCFSCVWKNYCRGGLQHGVQVNRWSKAKEFDNVSVLCAALRKIYSHVAYHMLLAGFPEDRMMEVLGDEQHTFIPASTLRLPSRTERGASDRA